jgi:hypothetical protein
MKPQAIFRAAAIILAIGGFSFCASPQTRDSRQISTCIHEARIHAAQAADDLAMLQIYSMTGIPWQVRFTRLQKVEDDLQALAKDTQHLYALSDHATTDQLFAMDRVEQLTKSLLIRVKESRRYLDYHSAAADMAPFRDRVNSGYASANEIVTILCQCEKKTSKSTVKVASRVPTGPHSQALP